MKKTFIFFIAMVFGFIVSCQKSEGPTSSELTEITISGMVIAGVSGDPLGGVTIKITDGDTLIGAVTNSQGSYSTVFGIDRDKDLIITASKTGFLPDTVTVFATKDNTTLEVPVFQLYADTSGNGGKLPSVSGDAASIYLFSQSEESIGVKESGSLESAEIIFEVRDSNGVPIDLDHAVTVNFKFGSHPEGGEYLYPTSVKTNTLGRATVVLNSGTVAGVVQVVAEINAPKGIIRSKPVLIAIHGGLPDTSRFNVAAKYVNYPALGHVGFEIIYTAYVGDKYTNPVRPGTAVYFSTNSGVIQGSALTDELGRATVKLFTQPSPHDSIYGAGFFTVTAYTANENYERIKTQTTTLLSGEPVITVDPRTLNLPNGGSQVYHFTVSDPNGNPLSPGQSINVSVVGGIDVVGDVSIKIPDVLNGYTSFTVTVFDKDPSDDTEKQAKVKFSTSGANGSKSITIFGTAR